MKRALHFTVTMDIDKRLAGSPVVFKPVLCKCRYSVVGAVEQIHTDHRLGTEHAGLAFD